MAVLHLVFLASLLGAASYSAPIKSTIKPAAVAEDFGPTEIDVDDYPPKYQKTYREIFLPLFGFRGEKARIINSPVIEMDPNLQAAEARLHPDLFSDARIAEPSPNGWKRKVQEILMKPPCCGACPVLTRAQGKDLWEFLVYDSLQRKTGDNADKWIRQRRDLIERFDREKNLPTQNVRSAKPKAGAEVRGGDYASIPDLLNQPKKPKEVVQ